MLAKDKSIEVDGCSGFVSTAKSGRPLMPNGVNSVLYNIVDAFNKTVKNISAQVVDIPYMLIINMITLTDVYKRQHYMR